MSDPDPTYPPTPMLNRHKAVMTEVRILNSFLDWCADEGIVLSIIHKHLGSEDPDKKDFGTGCYMKHECTDRCDCSRIVAKCKKGHCSCGTKADKVCGRREGEICEVTLGRAGVLAKHFNIDLKEVDREQQAILDWVRMTPDEREKAAKRRHVKAGILKKRTVV